MTIAELFINLGIKGSEKVGEALGSVRKGLSGVSSMSLEAKAGIVGVLYGLERLMSNSAATGQELVNFSAATGLSIKNLQQLQYSAQLAGVSVQETESTVTGLQSAMAKMKLTGEMPFGLAFVRSQTGLEIDDEHLKRPFYVFDKVVEYLKKSKDPLERQNEVAKSLGFTLNMVAAARRGLLDEAVRNSAPYYSDSQANALERVKSGWTALGIQWERMIGRLNSKHGLGIVKELSAVSTQFGELIEKLTEFSNKAGIFKLIGAIFEGWKEIFEVMNLALDKLQSVREETELNRLMGKGDDNSLLGRLDNWLLRKTGGSEVAVQGIGAALGGSVGLQIGKLITPQVPLIQKTEKHASIDVDVHNYGVDGAEDVNWQTGSSLNSVFRQFSSVNGEVV